MIKAIVAVGLNWEIGKNNDLLFKLPNDLKMFQEITEHNFVVCGANTLLSLPGGKPLKNRTTLVLCSKTRKFENCLVYHNFEKLLADIKILAKENDIYIIGGGKLYTAMLPYCDEVIVTKVQATDKDATVFFPNIDENAEFELSHKGPYLVDGDYMTQFCMYRKVARQEKC